MRPITDSSHRERASFLTRRDLLKAGAATAAAWAIPGILPAREDDPPSGGRRKPNIVVILADDMGFSDISLFGSEIPTPNIDRIGNEGMVFERFFNCAKCVPTRGSLMTGVQPHAVGAAGTGGGLLKPCVTLPEVLKAAGYRTGIAGKWHLKCDLLQRGFDEGLFVPLRGGIKDYHDPGPLVLDGKPLPAARKDRDFHMTDALNDYGIEFVRKHARSRSPFFLYLAHFAPHWAMQQDGLTGQAREEDYRRFEDTYRDGYKAARQRRMQNQRRLGLSDVPEGFAPLSCETPWDALSPEQQRKTAVQMANHAGLVHGLDRGIGRLLAALADEGIEQDTMVVFLSDNGASPEKSGFGPGWASASCTPLRFYKKHVEEGGISTPLLVRWPRRIPRGRRTAAMGHVMDWMATCLDMTGATYPEARAGREMPPLQGRSLLPVFAGQNTSPHDHLCFEYKGQCAVRTEKWKAVGGKGGRDWQLYDMTTDRAEQNDVSAQHPDILRRLTGLFDYWSRNGFMHKV